MKQKNVAVKKSKVQIQKEKQMNGSMRSTSKKTMKSMGIIAVHPEESIFQRVPVNGKSEFIKIYSIKGLDNFEMRKEMLIHSLCDYCESHRFRISSFQYAGNSVPIFFLSVYFYGSNYAEIYDDVRQFDECMEDILKQNIRITVVPCNISDIFMFIFMNYNGQLKKINQKEILRKDADWVKDYLKNISVTNSGFQLENKEKYGICYMATQYPDKIERIFDKIKQSGCGILSCIDVQKIPEKYVLTYREYIEQIYNGTVKKDISSLFNVSFLFSIFVDSENERKETNRYIKEYFEQNNLIVTNCNGIEEKVFDSIATMGVLDFSCMRNVDKNLIANLVV